MPTNLRVLSLFDGISGAQVALRNLGANPSVYHSLEINPHAIKVTQSNFPNTLQSGDVERAHGFPNSYDLMVFGSPCTDLSIARKNRQSLAGKSSGLFYKAVKLLREVRPKYFLMENVASMSDESKNEISDILGVSPFPINSYAFTGQNRQRLYWFNWEAPKSHIAFPRFEDQLLSTSDVFYQNLALSDAGVDYMNRKVKDGRNHWDFGHHSDTRYKKSACVVSNFKKGVPYNVLVDNRFNPKMFRRFHPIECERLQGFPDDYTKIIPWTYRYECIGNAFTVPVIQHLLKSII